jgi:3-oxoacyl-[acyl-carrier protein] reductase
VTAPPPYPVGHQLLEGKTVLVTAAAGTGIGFATAKRCAEEGAVVAISDRHERRLAESAERLAEVMGREPVAVPCDVTVEDDVRRMFDAVGEFDVLVNNAGLGGTAELAEMTDEQWSRVLAAHGEYFAGEVGRVVAREEDDDVRDLPRLGRAAERLP